MNRHERRKNPDQWWQLVAHARGDSFVELAVGERTVYLKGDVQGASVVQLPEGFEAWSASEQGGFVQGLQAVLEGAGIKNAVIVPHGINFLCLRPAAPEKSRELDRNTRAVQQHRAGPGPGVH